MLGDTCDVVTANGGQPALDILAADAAYDAIICDLMMPVVDGPAFYERAVALRSEVADRFIFTSAGVFTQRCRAFHERVAAPFLPKPINLGHLVREIRRLQQVPA